MFESFIIYGKNLILKKQKKITTFRSYIFLTLFITNQLMEATTGFEPVYKVLQTSA